MPSMSKSAGPKTAGSSRTAIAELVRDGTFVTLGIAMAAILLLVGTGSTWAQSVFVPGFDIARSHAVVASSLVLNIALVLLCWRRYRDLADEILRRKSGEERALDMAQRDSLTGLLNRRAITEQGTAALTQWPGRGDLVAAYMIDIDSFKSVNDLFGHAEGDAVISEVAARLQRAMPGDALLARIGGDEFVAMIPLAQGIDIAANAFGEQLVQILSVPLVAAGVEVPVSCSIGGALLDDAMRDLEALLNSADHAMYVAKRSGRCRYVRFDAVMAADMQHRARIASHLTGAVSSGEFTPVYEPLIDLASGVTQGYEMLARWHSPVLGQVSPEIFIPLVEEAGLIATMTDQLLRRAMQDATDWPADVTLSVNVSPVQLRDPWFAQKMLRLIAETGFPGSRLIIEITENALVDNVAMARTTFESLRNQGVRIALDDFGTGYSSIARLRELPFDSVKIDRDFIGRMSTDPTAAQITEAVLQLSQSLGLPVVAEGVENAEVAKRLAELNCTIAQGRLYGRSMTADEVRSLYHPPVAGRAVV